MSALADLNRFAALVLKATYVFRYAYDDEGLVILRVFHSSEQRET